MSRQDFENPACCQQLKIESLLDEQKRLCALITGLQEQISILGSVVQQQNCKDPDWIEAKTRADSPAPSIVSIPVGVGVSSSDLLLTRPLEPPSTPKTLNVPFLFDEEHDEPL
jgi:hypothetical protein